MKIFKPITINGVTIKNRVFMAPMYTQFDVSTQKARTYYQKRAEGGVGLLIIESVSVDLFENPTFVESIALLADTVHKQNARAIVQLAIPPTLPNSSRKIAPSAHGPFQQASPEEIQQCYRLMVKAALGCQSAGFDGIEIHGAHGYFMSQFFSPRTNTRSDKYGGDLTRRMRFAVESCKQVRKRVKNDFLISYRMSAEELVPGGVILDESVELAEKLESVGVNMIHVSAGIADTDEFLVTPDKKQPYGVFAEYAHKIKNAVNIPVISVGKIHTQEIAENILQEEKADCVSIGRALIADPFWPVKVQENRTDSIKKCRTCNLCIKTISKGKDLVCATNPNVGQE